VPIVCLHILLAKEVGELSDIPSKIMGTQARVDVQKPVAKQ